MNKLTDAELDVIVGIYPELKSIIPVAKNVCQTRSAIPAMMRSFGKREGVPEWVFDPPTYNQPDPNSSILIVFQEMLGELKGIRELLSK